MNAVAAAPSARRIAWLRRRRRASPRRWREYRHNTPGMVGLVILVAIVAMALAAPLLGRRGRPQGDQRDRQPGLGEPVASSARSAPTASAATC